MGPGGGSVQPADSALRDAATVVREIMRTGRVPLGASHRFLKPAGLVFISFCVVVACAKSSGPGSGGPSSNLGAQNGSGGASSGGAGSDDSGASSLSDDASVSSQYDDATPNRVTLPDVNLPDVPMIYQAYDGDLVNAPGGCKAGHYVGSFNGVYSSFVTFIGIPLDVSGTVVLDVDMSNNGEFFTISNGYVTGTASLLGDGGGGGGGIPYWCQVVGTLNCKTKQVDNGAIKNCGYCVGIADDAGNCLGLEGNFEGPVTGEYDSSIHAFINGTWAANEVTDANGPVSAADASADGGPFCSYGLFSYGGCGTWSAEYTPQ
jgi:hypothetical protein